MQTVKKTILIPSDFSEAALQTWATALSFSKAYDADIVILYVVEPPVIALDFEEEPAVMVARKMVADHIQKNGWDKEANITVLVKVGKPYKKILEAALEINPEMIVMGTNGASGLEEFFVGSNASRIIRSAPCPVVTVRSAQKDYIFERILLPLDLTKETKEKISKGIEVAKHFNASLHLVSVLSTSSNEVKETLEKQLQAAKDFIENHGVSSTAELITSNEEIGAAVVEYAEKMETDLICIMTQQEKKLKEYFIGTQAEHFVNHSPFPVLSIRPMNLYVAKKAGSIFG